MKRILAAALALSLLSSAAIAQPGNNQDRDQNQPENRGDRGDRGDVRGQPNDNVRRSNPRWSRGDRLPDDVRNNQTVAVNDWRVRGLRAPPRGYRWVRDRNNNYFLVATATGLISQTVYLDERQQRWERRYSRTYGRDDDVSYAQCRNAPNAGAVIIGALLGRLLGNAAGGSDNRTGATVAGVIVGGALGAAMTSNLDCDDRGYAYRAYSDAFNSGRPNAIYRWTNPNNGHRGQFAIRSYYYDQDNFRCANFTQTIYIAGRPQVTRGRACQQPDYTWVVVN